MTGLPLLVRPISVLVILSMFFNLLVDPPFYYPTFPAGSAAELPGTTFPAGFPVAGPPSQLGLSLVFLRDPGRLLKLSSIPFCR